MEFTDVIYTRHSVRDFKPEPVPEEVIKEMIKAAASAPSYQNRQCWRFILVRDPDRIEALALDSGLIGKVNFFIKKAPLVVVACADPAKSGTMNDQSYYLVDTAIAFQQMMLTAWNHGVGSCWLAAFMEDRVRHILHIPDRIRVVAMSPFGYPAGKSSIYTQALKTLAGSRKRLPAEKISCFDYWQL